MPVPHPLQPAEPPSSPLLFPAKTWLPMLGVMIALSMAALRPYDHLYRVSHDWSRLIVFGSAFADRCLPRIQRIKHYVDPDPVTQYGYDGQFYVQLAIDPSLRDPGLENALDNPTYRARRIGLPAFAFCLGLGKPRWIIQAYALANLIAWFVLASALLALLNPWTGQKLLCLAGALLGFGVIASMEDSLTDLPAAAMVFVGFAVSAWGRWAAFAAAILTRETSVLAAVAALDFRRPLERATLRRNLARLAFAAAPLALWLVYVHWRFYGVNRTSDPRTFSLPLLGMASTFADNLIQSADDGWGAAANAIGPMGLLYADFRVHELLTIAALFFQGVYLLARRNLASPLWRTGFLFLVLGCFLGSAVWENTSAAARALLPMTISFYLLLAHERRGWFWVFFVLGSLSIPYGVYDFWNLQ